MWKKCMEELCFNVSLLQKVFSSTGERSGLEKEIDFTLRLYGSSAENLKSSMAANDVGDYDIMVIPSSEDLLVDDEMIEYLPQHPLHVRVKGRDHTLLQFCLVEDTPYVTTSAIKEFHPLIYGTGASAIIKMLPRISQAVSRKSVWGTNMGEWENNEAGPALQMDFDHSYSTLELAERICNKHSFPNFDFAEMECLAFCIFQMCDLEYTKEDAELFEKLFKCVNDRKMAWQDDDSQEAIPAMLGMIIEMMEMRSLIFSQSVECLAEERKKDCHRSETGSEEEKVSQETLPSNGGSFLSPENAHGIPKIAEDLKATLSQLMMGGLSELSHKQSSQHSMSKEVSETDLLVNKNKEQRKNEGPNDSKSEADMSEEQPVAEKREPSCPYHTTHFILEHVIGPVSEVQKETDAKETVPTIMGGVDMVPSLRCPGWPQVAWDWVERDRKWPLPDVVEKVVQEGFHLVVKPPKNGGNPECNFRISFSHAEFLLSQEMNEVQRECYCCLKKFHRTYLSKDPEGLVSFHLKTLLLWTIEETGAEVWTEGNRVKCFMKLSRNLLQALTKKELPHFFVRSYNLLGADYVDDPKILETLAGKVKKMVENPVLSVKKLMLKVLELEKEKLKNTLSTIKTASEQGNAVEREETPHNDSRVALTPVKEGASCAVASLGLSYRFHDLKEIYLVMIQDLISLAFTGDDQTIEALEPLERALVGDFREMFEIDENDIVEFVENVEIVQLMIHNVFEKMWNPLYLGICMNPEPNMRHCILVAIKKLLEVLRDDSFPLHHLIPPGIATEIISRLFNKVTRSTAKTDKGDIPLD